MENQNFSLLTGLKEQMYLLQAIVLMTWYRAPQAIHVGSVAVGVNPLSVLSDKIVIRSVRVEAPEITFEGNPFSGNNLNTILKNVSAATKSSGPAATNTAAQKPAKKLQVDDFLITGAKVNFNGVSLPLPDTHLINLGKGSDGITPAELIRRVLDALTTASVKAVANATTDVGKDVGKPLNTGVSNISKSLGGLFKKSTN